MRIFKAHSTGGHVFSAPPRRNESWKGPGRLDGMIVILSGRYHARWTDTDGKHRFSAGPGEVVHHPGALGWFESNDANPRLTALSLYFTWANAPGDLPRKVHDRFGLIRTLVQAMLAIQDSSHPRRALIEDGYLAAALAEFCRLAGDEGEDVAAALTRYVYNHLRERITLAGLARHLGSSPRHLQRRFKMVTGQTPMQAVRHIRIGAAARMAGAGSLTLKEIALRVGVANEQALSAHLKKHTGLTAGQLRAGMPRRR